MPLFTRRRDSFECEPRGGSDTGIEGTVALGDEEKEPEEVFTVDEAIESIGMGFFQVIILSVAGLIWVSRTRACASGSISCMSYTHTHGWYYIVDAYMAGLCR